jgi:hypothetical protein
VLVDVAEKHPAATDSKRRSGPSRNGWPIDHRLGRTKLRGSAILGTSRGEQPHRDPVALASDHEHALVRGRDREAPPEALPSRVVDASPNGPAAPAQILAPDALRASADHDQPSVGPDRHCRRLESLVLAAALPVNAGHGCRWSTQLAVLAEMRDFDPTHETGPVLGIPIRLPGDPRTSQRRRAERGLGADRSVAAIHHNRLGNPPTAVEPPRQHLTAIAVERLERQAPAVLEQSQGRAADHGALDRNRQRIGELTIGAGARDRDPLGSSYPGGPRQRESVFSGSQRRLPRLLLGRYDEPRLGRTQTTSHLNELEPVTRRFRAVDPGHEHAVAPGSQHQPGDQRPRRAAVDARPKSLAWLAHTEPNPLCAAVPGNPADPTAAGGVDTHVRRAAIPRLVHHEALDGNRLVTHRRDDTRGPPRRKPTPAPLSTLLPGGVRATIPEVERRT